MCTNQTDLMRKLALQGKLDVPPAINSLLINVIDGKLPQVRQQLGTMNKVDAARWRQSALIIAAYARLSTIVDSLLDDGALVDGRGSMPGLKRNFHDQIVADVKKDPKWDSTNPDPKTALELDELLMFPGGHDAPALSIAVMCDDVKTLDIVFNHHADLEAQWPKGANLLLLPIIRGDTVMVQRLIDHGADPSDGLAAATASGHAAMVQFLLDHGAEPCRANLAIRKPGVTVASLGKSKGLPDSMKKRLVCPTTATMN
ncbi:hypothetical protein B0E50_01245 [Rhodanobacter sp. C01]|nr:hypothetical protein B0E50_01245 [Rhodanobacter sp. C01]